MDSVTWLKGGVEVGPEFIRAQTLVDPATGMYEQTLSSDSIAVFVGDFTCEVRDTSSNTDSRTRVFNGTYNRKYIVRLSVVICHAL